MYVDNEAGRYKKTGDITLQNRDLRSFNLGHFLRF